MVVTHYRISRKEELYMIPQPKRMIYRDGEVRKETEAEEVICPELKKEEYRIHISPEKILLEGSGETGLFYAQTTLKQLRLSYGDTLPCMDIEDVPSYPYRAFHIDCARHYFSVDELKKMIRMSAEFKLNYFHWHISDDQGWRIESRRYPKLHETGSVREGDYFGSYASDKAEGGYYTQEEVRELVSYCRQYGIEIVPEIDMPGHVTAVLAAYPELSCQGNPVKTGTKAGIYKEIFCAGKEEVYTFIENLLDEMLALFPGKYFHIGGDEAPKERWRACPCCQRRIREEGLKNEQELQGYMENRVVSFLLRRGRTPVVWNEAVYGGNLDSGAAVQVWTEDRDHQVRAHLEKGGKAIMSVVPNSYCDYPYGMHTLKDIYELDTVPAELGEQAQSGILGTECLIWTEFVRDNNRLEEMSWPRFAASAEAGWCGTERSGYDSFQERLKKVFPLFSVHGISVTPPEGWIPDKKEAARQTEEFQKNFSKEDMEEARKAQEDI